MAKFDEADEALEASVEMQNALIGHNQRLKQEHEVIQIRIGIHSGLAMEDMGDYYGDTINTAARIESKAEGNEIFISKNIWDNLKQENKDKCILIGNIQFKGKTNPIEIYAVNWRGYKKEEFVQSISSASMKGSEDRPVEKRRIGKAAEDQDGVYILEPFCLPPPRSIVRRPPEGNPYLNRVMIINRSDFFGRRAAVRKLFAKIDNPSPQSVSIVGDRKIGKSSLLNFLMCPVTREKHLSNSNRFVFVYIDFQQFRGNTIEDFFRAVFNGVIREFLGNIVINVEPDYKGFLELIEEFEKKDLVLIFLFDEFEVITRNSHFDHDFFAFFRSMANSHPVAYYTTSGRRLQEMCHTKEISDSPFFNIFTNFFLGPFNRQEALELICQPSAVQGVPLEPYAEDILSIAGCLPFYLQVACSSYFELLREHGEKSDSDILKEAVQGFMEEAQVHFDYLLENLNDDELTVLKAIALDKRIPNRYEQILQGLKRRGIVMVNEDRYNIFSHLFKDYLFSKYHKKSGSFWRRISGR